MADLTGLNPEQASAQIADFYTTIEDLAETFWRQGAEVFMEGLSTAWCSPRAYDFSGHHFPKLYSINTNIENMAYNICVSATAAYNYLARSNGSSGIGEDGYFKKGEQLGPYDDSGYDQYSLKEESPNGIVGMNVAQVKVYLSLFKDAVNTLVTGLDTVPIDIAFYDPEGVLKESYKAIINNMIKEINDLTAVMYKDLDDAFDAEINTIMLAKDNAVGTLSA